MKKLSKKEKVVLILIGLLTVALPFIMERILFEENFFPFNIRIAMSREVWFGFIASYLGAIGAFTLGYVAYKQNKKYNDQSTEFVSKQQALLENIQNLNQQQADNLLRHKYYDNLVSYIEKLEKNYALIKKYSGGWVKRYVAKNKLNEIGSADFFEVALEQDEQKERMNLELLEVKIMFSNDLFFFEGKEKLFDTFVSYKKTLDKLCENGENLNKEELQNAIDETTRLYKDLVLKYNLYILKVKRLSLNLLENEITVNEYNEVLDEMRNTLENWLKHMNSTDA